METLFLVKKNNILLQYSDLKDRVQGSQNLKEKLPKLDLFSLTGDDRAKIFLKSYDAWYQLSNIQRESLMVDPPCYVPYSLKDLRKFGLILNTSYLLFDVRHKLPIQHKFAVSIIGKYNENPSSAGLTQVKNALNLIRDSARNIYSFTPTNDESYETTIQKILKYIDGYILEFLANGSLPISNFHHLRKSLRHIMNVYQGWFILSPDQVKFDVFANLFVLNKITGSMHDRVINLSKNGTLIYDSAKMDLDSSLANRLIEVKNAYNHLI